MTIVTVMKIVGYSKARKVNMNNDPLLVPLIAVVIAFVIYVILTNVID